MLEAGTHFLYYDNGKSAVRVRLGPGHTLRGACGVVGSARFWAQAAMWR